MPTTTAVLEIPDATSEVLAAVRDQQAAVDAAEVGKLRLAVAWAAMHSPESITGSITGPGSEWSEHAIPLAGEGAPGVAEFCVPELAVALGVSHDSAGLFVGDAVELAHRLPLTFARVLVGGLRVWKARRIAQATRILSPDGAGFVDRHVAPVAHSIGVAALDRLVEEAVVRFDPERAEAERQAAADGRRFDIDLRHVGHDGTAWVTGNLDYADACDLEAAVAQGAADLAALGSEDSVDVRRSVAAGELARRQLAFDLASAAAADPAAPADAEAAESDPRSGAPHGAKPRQVVLHVHLADSAVARVEGLGPTGGCVSVEQVKAWCGATDTAVTIQPVIDLNATPRTDAYEIPDRIRTQVILRDVTCVFPLCTRNARRCDVDHVEPWDSGGPTTPSNLTSLCRRHHRLKTTGGWRYRVLAPGSFEWTSPHGQVVATGRGSHAPPDRRRRT